MDSIVGGAPQVNLDDVPTEALGLTPVVWNILKNAHIKTLGDIIAQERERGLLKVRNLGKKHYLAIQSALFERGISLDGTPLAQTQALPVQVAEPVVVCPAVPTVSNVPTAPVVPAVHTVPTVPTVSAVPAAPAVPTPLKTAVFVDFEHWYIALKNIHNRRPNIQAWFEDLRTRGRLLEVTFFGDFSDSGGMRDELDNIRRFSNRIVETKNISPYAKASFTDFIMLDNMYQKIISSPELEQVVLFTGDGDFCSVVSYLRNFCGKTVGIYGIDNAISSQLESISDWCVRIPFSNEPCQECRYAILKNLQYAESHTKSPTFRATVRLVAEYYDLPEDAVEAELRLLLNEGIIYTMPERSRRDYTIILNILHVRWDLVNGLDP